MNPIMQYPVFEANQVLTPSNLNNTISYLTSQDLSTRRNLIGIGISCGLNHSSNLSTNVIIEAGCGVTSLGHLITTKRLDLAYYRLFTDRASTPYSHFIDASENQYPLWELLTEEEYLEADDPDNDKALTELTEFNLGDMVLMLYLEIVDEDLKNCIGQSCDEQGMARRFYLRKLLVSKTDALSIIRNANNAATATTEDDLYKSIYPGFNLNSVKNRRLNYNLADLTSLNLGGINSLPKLNKVYKEIIGADVVQIGTALFNSYESFNGELKNLYSGNNNPFTDFELPLAANKLHNTILASLDTDEINIQYAFDFLCDLVKAYEEFCDAAVQFRATCCPDADLFPLHLMLGCLQSSGLRSEEVYRTAWMPSPAVTSFGNKLEHLRALHYKIYLMVENFNPRLFSTLSDIKITPGRFTGHALSEHSIPYYYFREQNLSDLVNKWNYDLYKKNQVNTILSYFASDYSSKPFAIYPLLYTLRDYEFFRIEGHVGQELKGVENQLNTKIRDFNLPFDLLSIKLSADHLDISIEDSCFVDLQAIYKINRDEYLSCINALSTLINAFVNALTLVSRRAPNIMNMPLGNGESQFNFIGTVRQAFMVLQMYAFFLNRIKQYLPEHIKDFKYQPFRIVHFIVYAFTLFGEFILEFLSNTIRELSASFLQVMLLKTFFSRIIDDCMDAKFKSIYDLYNDRLLKTQLGRLFPGFVTGSPGMEHLGGVKEGGTFILVYDEMPETEPTRPERPTGTIIDDDDPCFQEDDAKYIQLKVLQYAHLIATEPILLNDMTDGVDFEKFNNKENVFSNFKNFRGSENTEKVDADGNLKEEEANITMDEVDGGKSKARRQQKVSNARVKELEKEHTTVNGFLEFLFGKFDDEQVIDEKTYRVVADFAVPFRCCKSCLQIDELPQEIQVTINIKPNEFCFRDPGNSYPVNVSPAGGTLTSSDGGINDQAPFTFTPSEVSGTEEEVILTYTFEDATAQTTVMVYNPIAAFQVEESVDENGRPVVRLINQSVNADSYKWTIEEIDFQSTQRNVEMSRERLEIRPVTITLIALRGQCESEPQSQDLDLTPQVPTVFALQQIKGRDDNHYCNNDGGRYQFSTFPGGESITGNDGLVSNEGGSLYFRPLDVTPGTYTFNYIDTPLTVRVFEPVEIGFSHRIVRTLDGNRVLVELTFIGELEGEATWYFGDNSESISTAERVVQHLYNANDIAVFNVRIVMSNNNGVCNSGHYGMIDLSLEVKNDDYIIDVESYNALNLNAIVSSDARINQNFRFTEDLILTERFNEFNRRVTQDSMSNRLFLSGAMNNEVSNLFGVPLNRIRQRIMFGLEQDNIDDNETRYLTSVFIAGTQSLVVTIDRTSRDISTTSQIYETLAQLAQNLKELRELGVDINPNEAMAKFIESAQERVNDKANLASMIDNYKQI